MRSWLSVFEIASGRELKKLPSTDGLGMGGVAFSPDGKLLASRVNAVSESALAGSVNLIETGTWREVRALAKTGFGMSLGRRPSRDAAHVQPRRPLDCREPRRRRRAVRHRDRRTDPEPAHPPARERRHVRRQRQSGDGQRGDGSGGLRSRHDEPAARDDERHDRGRLAARADRPGSRAPHSVSVPTAGSSARRSPRVVWDLVAGAPQPPNQRGRRRIRPSPTSSAWGPHPPPTARTAGCRPP